jgi:hypothetical protein
MAKKCGYRRTARLVFGVMSLHTPLDKLTAKPSLTVYFRR